MNILLVNKYLYLRGGAETYVRDMGKLLTQRGHRVQYFGMEHPRQFGTNQAGAYVKEMDFHACSLGDKIRYLWKVIYSREAYRSLMKLLEEFQPDVVHLNNFNYQLTPSVICAVRSWQRRTGKRVRIVYTAHDYQLVCPNHMLYSRDRVCTSCLEGSRFHCTRNRCIHNSLLRSLLGTAEAAFWRWRGIYRELDAVICPSRLMAEKLASHPHLRDKLQVLHNPVCGLEKMTTEKEDYVLYFGRYSPEKGMQTMVQACRARPDIPFRFAGTGPLGELLSGLPNVTDLGFMEGKDLHRVIAGARFSVYPSQWPENCPYSVLESQLLGTPVLGARIGGIPELIQDGVTGALFESGNIRELTEAIGMLWENPQLCRQWGENAAKNPLMTEERYYEALMECYLGGGIKV